MNVVTAYDANRRDASQPVLQLESLQDVSQVFPLMKLTKSCQWSKEVPRASLSRIRADSPSDSDLRRLHTLSHASGATLECDQVEMVLCAQHCNAARKGPQTLLPAG